MPVPASILFCPFAFNTFTPEQPRVTAPVTANTPFDIELADSTHVDARKHVNTSVCAVARCMAQIPFTFPQSYRKVTLRQPAGGDVSCLQPMPEAALIASLMQDAGRGQQQPSASDARIPTLVFLGFPVFDSIA